MAPSTSCFSLRVGMVALLCAVMLGVAGRAADPSPEPYRKVAPLAKEWMVYEGQLGEYVPFLPKIHRDKQQVHLLVHPDSLPASFLSIYGQAGAYLFVDRQLAHTWVRASWLHLKLDSLRQIFPVPVGRFQLITYHLAGQPVGQPPPAFVTQLDSLAVGPAKVNAVAQTVASGTGRRVSDPRKSYLTVSLLVVMTLVALFSQVNGPLFSIRYFGSAIAAIFGKERELAKRLELGSFILFMVYYGVSVAYIALFADTFTTLIRLPAGLYPQGDFTDWLVAFVVILVGMAFFITAKYWLLLLFAILYNDRSLAIAHIHEFMNLSRLFCTLFVLLTLVLNASPMAQIQRFAPVLFGAFALGLVVKGGLVCYRVNKLSPHRSLYLFAYLCSVELIPVLASLKIFVTV
jgi:Domain of unknown function (DUF4271)